SSRQFARTAPPSSSARNRAFRTARWRFERSRRAFLRSGRGPLAANSLKNNNCTYQFSYALTRVDSITKPYCTVRRPHRQKRDFQMIRSRATRFSRAGILLPMLLATACAAVPDLGARPVPAAAGDYASARSLSAPQSDWPAEGWWRKYDDPQ